MTTINVKYGTENYNHTANGNVTVGDILRNNTVKAVLGFGDNVKGLVNGVEMSVETQLTDGTELVVETKANSKATA